MTKARFYLQACRPKTLAISFCAVLVPYSLYLKTNPSQEQLCLLLNILITTCLIQIISNLANDIFDHQKGIDVERDGPTRVIAAGLISEVNLKIFLVVITILCLLSAIPLVIVGGVPIIVIGITSLLFAYLYTASPFALAYIGFSELAAFTFFGPVASLGTYYLLTDSWNLSAVLIGISPGFFSLALLLINNLRDFENDRKFFRKNFVISFGKKIGFRFYQACLFLAVLILYLTLQIKILLLLLLVTSIFSLYLNYKKENYKFLFSATILLCILSTAISLI